MNSPLSTEMYTLLAMAARYFFTGLMILIVFRAWRITIRDNRRAKLLRDLSPETGCVGELILNPGTRNRETLPVPREGVLGSGYKADIRIRDKDILPAHAHVEEREGGLLIRPLGRAQIALGKGGFTGDQLFARDGDVLMIGRHQLLIVLFEPESPMQNQFAHGDIPLSQTTYAPPKSTGTGRPQQSPPLEPPPKPAPTKPSSKSSAKPAVQIESTPEPKVKPKPEPKPKAEPKTKPSPTPSAAKPKPKPKPAADPFAAAKPSAKPTKSKRSGDPFSFFDETDDDFFDEDKLWNGHRK